MGSGRPVGGRARTAVIGGGIAGLSAAYHLREHTDVTLYERSPHAGGHANTIVVEDGGRTVGLDTAFVVYNEPFYPRLTAFFAELGVPTRPHTGGFDFVNLDTGVQFGSEEFDLDEAAVRSGHPPEFLRLWQEAKRFHRDAPRDFIRKRAEMPLGAYLDANGYSDAFRHDFIVLIATAAWSVPAERIWEMPASTVIAFFMAHGVGGLGGRSVEWRTVQGGSIAYVRRVLAALAAADTEVSLGTAVHGVRTGDDRVTVLTALGPRDFDAAVVATHADEAARLIASPTPRQQLLGHIRYSPTRATLHTDPSVMGPDRSRWASWNYARTGHGDRASSHVVYYLNKLQSLRADRDYFLTLDAAVDIRPDTIIRDLSYTHPVLDTEVRGMQEGLRSANDGARVKICGSYFQSGKLGPVVIGSHESAFDSGRAAAAAVLRDLEHARIAVS